jgi:hypothetical protein
MGDEAVRGQHWLIPQPIQSGESLFVFGFHLFGTSGSAELPEPMLQRLLCYALIQRLPDEGLAEAMQSLVDMNEFYRLPRFVSPQSLSLPQQSVPARITGSYVEPVYPVTED